MQREPYDLSESISKDLTHQEKLKVKDVGEKVIQERE